MSGNDGIEISGGDAEMFQENVMGDDGIEMHAETAKRQAREKGEKPKEKAPEIPEDKDEGSKENLDGNEENVDDENLDDNEENDADEAAKSTNEKPKDRRQQRIRELNKRVHESERRSARLEGELEALKSLLQGRDTGDNSSVSQEDLTGPDHTDAEKYPLGHLDPRYVEDRTEWLAERKAKERADAALQREQQARAQQQAEADQQALLGKVQELSTKGAAMWDDFHEEVVETGMRGEWKLQRPTFEAASEADHGAQILRELARDKAEAARVAGLSDYQQIKYVQKRDAEISEETRKRKIPQAGAPAQTQTRGANSRVAIRPDTDNLDDFERLYYAKK